jgi:hypothetical protein
MGVVEKLLLLLPLLEMKERIASPRVVVVILNGRRLLVARIILKWGSEKCCVCGIDTRLVVRNYESSSSIK